MKKLFTVTIEHEVVVLADSEDDAFRIAGALDSREYDSFGNVNAQPMRYLPDGWTGQEPPFGVALSDQRSVDEWAQDGAAPEYEAIRARLEAAREAERARRTSLLASEGQVKP